LVVGALALNVGTTLALQVGLGLGRTGGWSARYPLQNTVLIVGVLVVGRAAGGLGGAVVIVVAALVGAAFAAVLTAPLLRPAVAVVALPEGALRFGVLQATGAGLVQLTHRGGVLATALLAGSAAETGYVALATGIALGVTYAVLQAFTVSLPHLAGEDATAGGEEVLRRLAGGLLAVLVPGVLLVAATLDELVPRIFGDGYLGATDAFAPALALVVLAPLNALAVQAAALRLRPDVAATAGAASAIAFVVVAFAAVPAWGAAGATAAALAGASASAVVAVRSLPGAVGTPVGLATAAGAAAVLLVATIA
jgi:O-antigen/teichoic acid export membrane protein